MTTDDQNRAIAEWTGWKLTVALDAEALDFTADLNAMHDVEKRLSHTTRVIYTRYLRDVCADIDVWNATAAQRAEALLKSIGRWKDQ